MMAMNYVRLMPQECFFLMKGFKKGVVHRRNEPYLVFCPTGIIWDVGYQMRGE